MAPETPSDTPVVDVLSAQKTYPNGTQALLPVDLTVREGEFVAVTGPSGSGKTTFLTIAGLLEAFSAGSYKLDGIDVSRMGDAELESVLEAAHGIDELEGNAQRLQVVQALDEAAQVALPVAVGVERRPRDLGDRVVAVPKDVGERLAFAFDRDQAELVAAQTAGQIIPALLGRQHPGPGIRRVGLPEPLLRDEAHYLPLVTYRAPFQAVVVGLASMPAGSPAAQLNGKTVLGLSPSSTRRARLRPRACRHSSRARPTQAILSARGSSISASQPADGSAVAVTHRRHAQVSQWPSVWRGL